MKIETAFPGARGFDSLPFCQSGTPEQANAMGASGEFFVAYIGVINSQRLRYLLDAGLGVMFVTLAGRFDGKAAVAQLRALGVPPGVSVWLDLEGKYVWDAPKQETRAKCEAWCAEIRAAGYMPCLYVAPPQPFTGPELYSMSFVRYWTSAGRIQSKDGRIWDEPEGCGWCMFQLWHGNSKTGGQNWPVKGSASPAWVDVNAIQYDRKNRLPVWVRA